MPKSAQSPPPDSEQLLRAYRLRPDPALAAQIVEAHLYLAAIVARRFSGRGVEYDDLYQVASLALYKALERYDPDRGVKFITYVTPNMVGEVKNYFRDRSRAIRLPRRGRSLLRRIEACREELTQRLQRQPTADEIAAELDVPLEDVIESLELHSAAWLVSLDALPPEDDDSAPLSTFLGIEEPGFDEFERRDLLTRGLEGLSDEQRTLLRRRFFEGKSQREVAEQLGVSQMWVSRAERKALEQLRAATGENKKKK